MRKVTAIIPTFNEENHIGQAIESLNWADEIIVVDSFSTDATVDIANEFDVEVTQHEYISPAAQKNWIIPQAKHEWIFILDADERVPEALREEMQQVLSSEQISYEAFWIPRINYYMGKKVRFSGWQNDGVIRLFKRDSCRYEQKRVHEEIVTDGKIAKLNEPLLHFTYKDLKSHIRKVEKYATWKAIDKFEKGDRSGLFSLMAKPSFSFIKNYFFRLGILDGKVGFIICVISSWSVFYRQLLIWRMQEGENVES